MKKTFRKQPKITGVAERIKGKPAKEKHKEKVDAYRNLSTPIEYSYNGIDITIEYISKQKDLLKVFASAEINGKEQELNNPFLFKNPPVLVPDGTWHKEERELPNGKKEEVEMPNYKCHLTDCLKEIMGQVIEQQVK